MLKQIDLPLSSEHCYFCMLEDEKYGKDSHLYTCGDCKYGERYGICNQSTSHYNKLMRSLNELRRDVMNYYKMTED